MLIPVRCFSCNKPVSRYYLEYIEYKKNNKDLEKFFEEKGIKKYCCRRMLFTHVDVYKTVKESKQ
jgi:DNA-directed RNA polymerase subunit N